MSPSHRNADPVSLVARWRRELLEFHMKACIWLDVSPIVKYTALSFFADRFLHSLPRISQEKASHSWLLHPLRESNLQLFIFVSLWISSKIHDTSPLSSKTLKYLGDKHIKDQHFTMRDFAEAEIVFVEVLNSHIGASNIAFNFLEELLIQFRTISKFGDHVRIHSCMDIMDVLYETEESARLYDHPHLLASAILVASYVLTVPTQRWEFPLLQWVTFATPHKEEDVVRLVNHVLEHILGHHN